MKKKFIIVMVIGVLILSIGLSYSYFTGTVSGGEKKLEVVAKNVRILFTDDKEISNATIKPGWSEAKSFSVKNESNGVFNYNIVFEKLVNTFITEGYLKYKIISTDGGYTMEDYINVPKSSSPTDYVLAYDIDIEPGVTHNYTIEFVYINDENVDQSVDMGKEFSGNLAIMEGTVDPNIKYTVTMIIDESIGEVSPTSGESLKKGALDFIVTPKDEYDISTMNVECDPVANVVVLDNNIKVNDIRQNHNCNITMSKKKYTVEIKVNNGSSNAKNKIIEHGESATATITPDYGYTLTGATVTGEGCSLSDGTLTISNVTKPGTCEITLERDTYTVTLIGVGLNTSNSPQTAEYEGSATLNYTLKDGYYMGESSVNCDYGTPVVNGNTITVSNVTANTTCTITPTLSSYNVTLKVNGGTVNNKTEDTISVQHGSSGTFSIAASTGYKLELNGSISCEGAIGSLSGSTVTISGVTKAQTCTVNLKHQDVYVSISVNNSSYGSVSPASTTVEYGSNLKVIITPTDGYQYSSNNCGGTVSGNTMTISNITASKSCSVLFTAQTYTVSVNVKGGTSIPTYISGISSGENVKFTIEANSMHKTDRGRYSGDGCAYYNGEIIVYNVTYSRVCTLELPLKDDPKWNQNGSSVPQEVKTLYADSIDSCDYLCFDEATFTGYLLYRNYWTSPTSCRCELFGTKYA